MVCRPTGIPYGTIDIGAGVAHNPDNPGSSLSEVLNVIAVLSSCMMNCCITQVGSVQLELHYLTFHTGNPKYAEAVDKAMKAVLVR